jgi:predicted Rossmann-fold nucleotide-binding protein
MLLCNAGGIETLDELFEALTLIQNKNNQQFPIVIFDLFIIRNCVITSKK